MTDYICKHCEHYKRSFPLFWLRYCEHGEPYFLKIASNFCFSFSLKLESRPIKGEDTHDIDPPKDSRGYEDYTCPCLNEDDYWYSWYPSDEWFCAEGEAKGEVNGI